MENVNQLFDLTKKSDSIMPPAGWNRPFNEFTCEYCGQHFSKEFCQISVFLHGIIFLFGQETGYLGFTCANCLKTILFKGTGSEIRALHSEITADSFSFNGALRLSYFSSINYYPSQFPCLNKFDIKCSGHFVIDPWIAKHSYLTRDVGRAFTDGINCTNIDIRPDLHQNYLCSDQDQLTNYTYNYLGYLATLWWFKEDEIIKLRDLENSRNLRIFPRYVSRQFADLEPIENYCWKHQLYSAFLNIHLKKAEITNKEIKESKYYMVISGYTDPEDEEDVITDDNTIPLWRIEDSIREEGKRRKTDLSQTAELTKILITPKNYWLATPGIDIQQTLEYWNNASGLFESKKISKVITDFMPEDTEKWRQEKIEFHKMARLVRENFNKTSVQEFLTENHFSFISAYTKLAQSNKISYASVWRLKEDILQSLCQHIRDKQKGLISVGSTADKAIEEQLGKNDDVVVDFEELKKEIDGYRNKFPAFRKIVSNNIQILTILQEIYIYASGEQNKNFLIIGEKGTGKELFAQAIHEATGCHKKLISANCAAIPENLFESEIFGSKPEAGIGTKKEKKGYLELADRGSIFFDEVGKFPLQLQPKLLRTIAEREIAPVGGTPTKINANFIFATNANLEQMVTEGLFEGDLFDRIFPYASFKIPPLRERKEDIPLLVDHFVNFYASIRKIPPPGIPEECLSKLMQYDWPGNIRVLKKQIERIITFRSKKGVAGPLTISEFNIPKKDKNLEQIFDSHQANQSLPLQDKKNKGKRGPQKTDQEIIAAYHKCEGNISKALRYLGQGNKNNLRKRLVKLGVHIPKK